MQLDRRLLAGVCGALSLVASQSHAQPAAPADATAPAPTTSPAPAPTPAAPESLETPYADTPPPTAPPAPPPAPPSAQPAASPPPRPRADTRPLGPIRSRRRLALMGELGWNGLAGFGPVLTYHVDPHFSVDLGAGGSLLGWKAGVRPRYNLFTTPFTPFVGVGFDAAMGLGQITSDPKDRQGDTNTEPFTINVKASYLVQGVVGFDFIHKRGFTMVGCLGYAWLLNHDNVDVLAGTLSPEDRQVINAFFKSGAVVSFAAGYAWE